MTGIMVPKMWILRIWNALPRVSGTGMNESMRVWTGVRLSNGGWRQSGLSVSMVEGCGGSLGSPLPLSTLNLINTYSHAAQNHIMRKTISPDDLGDAISGDIASRIKAEIKRSGVIGPNMATKISWDSKKLTVVVVDPDVPEPVKAELHRIVEAVLGEIGTPKD